MQIIIAILLTECQFTDSSFLSSGANFNACAIYTFHAILLCFMPDSINTTNASKRGASVFFLFLVFFVFIQSLFLNILCSFGLFLIIICMDNSIGWIMYNLYEHFWEVIVMNMDRSTRKKERRFIGLLLLALLLLFALPALGEDRLFDFEDGANPGFMKYGPCVCGVTEEDPGSGTYSLAVTGRPAGRNSGVEVRIGKLGIGKGDTVAVSFLVRQTSDAAGSVILSAAADDAPIIVSSPVLQSGQWTEVSAQFTCETNGNLRFSTDEALYGADFYLDDLRVSILSAADRVVGDWGKWRSDLPSLKEIYKDHFLFGSALAGTELMDMGRLLLCRQQFAILTPGNELKPDSVFDQPASRKLIAETGDETQVAVKLDAAKSFLRFCQASGIPVHGHTLLWHNQTPANFFRLGYNSANELASREIMLGRMENYIKAVMEITEKEYPGLIVSWDVVNEVMSDSVSDIRTDVLWYKTVGPDYIEKAFEFARKYARPGVLLCYNDYSTPNPTKLKGIMKLLATLTKQGNIDCYGFQAHYDTGWPSVSLVESAIRQISALGLKIRVSEMDIKVSSKSDANFNLQAKRYRELMDLFLKYDKDIIAVQIWGVTDDTSWLASDYPLPFAAYGEPKPAFWALTGQDQ